MPDELRELLRLTLLRLGEGGFLGRGEGCCRGRDRGGDRWGHLQAWKDLGNKMTPRNG